MYRLLIVDDEELIVNSLSNYISAHFDLELHRAYSAFEAIEALRKMRFDIVVTDISMPAMDGLELLNFIKRYWPACRVIILTAYNDFQYAYNTLKYDNVDFILKVEEHEVIRKTIEQNLIQIESEQDKEQLFFDLGKRISRMTPYLRSDMLNMVLKGGEPLPEQEELDMLELPLSRKSAVLLTAGLISGKLSSEVKKRLSEISDYIEKTIRLRNIGVVFHIDECYAVWLIQQTKDCADQPLEDIAAYIREVFGELPDRLMKQTGETMTFVVGKSFVDWYELHSVYKKTVMCLERFRGESGLQMVETALSEKSQIPDRTYPGLEELNRLWSLLKNEKKDAFIHDLSEYMAYIRKIDDLKSALPLPSVSAIELLMSEAIRLFDLDAPEYMACNRQLYNTPCISGTQWLNTCLSLFEKVFDNREAIRKSRFSSIIKHVNKYIELHFTEDISISNLAEIVHYNPSYLSRIYKEQTGNTLMDYINKMRLVKAKELLHSSTMKISEIANLSGFNSTKYFNQAFKKAVGVSAHTYRQDFLDKG